MAEGTWRIVPPLHIVMFHLTETGVSRVTAAMNRLQSQMQALVDERLMSERRRQIEDLATKVVTLEADRREAKSELRATEQRHQAEIKIGHGVSMACYLFVEPREWSLAELTQSHGELQYQ